MRKKTKELLVNPLFAGSAVMVVGSNLVNFLNYLYHLIMGRLLGPSLYGDLTSLLSFIGLTLIVPTSLGLVIVKFISSAKRKTQISSLLLWLTKKAFLAGGLLMFLTLAASPLITSFLSLTNGLWPIFFIALTFAFALPATLFRSVLQGLLRFDKFLVSLLVDTGTKLFLGVFLVVLGFSVAGAMAALVLAATLGLLVSLHPLKDYWRVLKREEIHLKPMAKLSLPVLIQSLAATSLYSTDLLLVKHFFKPFEAGLYGAVSMLARIIFFAAGPVSAVMFPLVSRHHARGKPLEKVFFLSLGLSLVVVIPILSVYWLFPEVTIFILYGQEYLAASNYLIWFGIFMALFTLSSLMVNFFLSVGKTYVVLISLTAAVSQAVLIFFFHSSLFQVITISMGISSLLLVILLLYYFLNAKT